MTEPATVHDDAAPRRPVAPYVVLVVALLVGGLFLLLAGSKTRVNQSTGETPLLGRPAPEVAGPTLGGDAFQLSRRRGSWVVLNFFQSSCVPCVREHPELVEFAAQQATSAARAELVTVVWRDTAAAVRDFFSANGGDWEVVFDDNLASVDYGVAKVPETWIIDPAGVVRARFISEVDAAGLSAAVKQLRVALAGG